MISARPITVLLRNPTAFGGLCERGTLRDRVIGHWLAHGCCNLSMSHESVKVQVWFDEPTNDGETYVSIRCPACARVHLVNPVTGKTPANG